MDENELKELEENYEYEKYEKSGSKDSFEIWKVKKYIDERFLIAFVVVVIFLYFLLR